MSTFSAKKLNQLIDHLKYITGHRWTIREIAEKTDISPAYLTLLKNGQRTNPSMDMVLKLSEFFNVPPDDLLEAEIGSGAGTQRTVESYEMTTPSPIRQTIQMSEQLIQSNNPQQALELLKLIRTDYLQEEMPDLYQEAELARASALVALRQYEEAEPILATVSQEGMPASNRLKALYLQSRMLYQQEKYRPAISSLQAAKDLADSIHDSEYLYKIHYSLGLCYNQSSDLGASIYHYEMAYHFFPESLHLVHKAHLSMGMGLTYMRLHSLNKAREIFQYAYQIYNDLGEIKYRADIEHNLACIDTINGEYEAAVEQFLHCLPAFQSLSDHVGIANTLYQLAICYKEMKRWSEMEDNALRAVITYENLQQKGQAARAHLLLAEAQFQRHPHEADVLPMIDKAYDVFTELDWTVDQAKALYLKATVFQQRGELETALGNSLDALALYSEHHMHVLEH